MLSVQTAVDIRACDFIFADMGTTFKFYKRRFRNALEPIFVMLIDRKSRMNHDAWHLLLEKVTKSILNKPHEFLGAELPSHEMTCDVLYEIFEQFIREKGHGKMEFQKIARLLLESRSVHAESNTDNSADAELRDPI